MPYVFICDAIYHGTQIVKGAVSPSMLSSLAEIVLSSEKPLPDYNDPVLDKQLPRGDRCQLQIDDEKLKISCIKKDEGFESDSESSTTSSSDASCGERLCTSHEIKVIQDHVLRLEKLIRQDSGFQSGYSQPEDGGLSLSSSGAESEEESSKTGHYDSEEHRSLYASSASSIDPGVSARLRNMSSSLLDKDIRKIQADTGSVDYILMSDILFCHVLSHRPKVVIVVVKSVESSLIHAHVFECLSHEAARTLYSNYHIASNKYKLNRYRYSRRRNDAFIGPDDKATLDRIHVSIRNIRRRSFESLPEGQHIDELNESIPTKSFLFGELDEQPTNKVDNSNINIIEIRDTQLHKEPFSMMHRVDSNGVTHIEIESAPCSLVIPPSPIRQPPSKANYEPNDILSALDRLSLHSAKNPNSYLNGVGITGSCPNSLISTSREILAAGERERKSRQRQPPLFIPEEQQKKNTINIPRKEGTRRRNDRRNRSRSNERKDADSRSENRDETRESHKISSDKNQRITELETNPSQKLETKFLHDLETNLQERQSRSRNPRSRDTKEPHRSTHNKGPAPPPPPRRHPTNPSLILIPTKSGHEITKSYYPKESHIIRGNKFIRIDYPVYPPWNMNADINNNPQRIYYAHPGWMGSHEFHSSRSNDSFVSNELRRRSRSKSPARRPMGHRYIDAMTTLNISQKLKDFSDSVKHTLKNTPAAAQLASRDGFTRNNERKSKNNLLNITSGSTDDALRPVMKKGRKTDNSRRVRFSAYATVQVMEP